MAVNVHQTPKGGTMTVRHEMEAGGGVDVGVGVHDQDPEFVELRRRHRSFVFPMTAVFFVYYMLLMIGAGFWTGLFEKSVYENINVGYLFALSQFVMSFIIAFAYTRYANRRLDPLAADIRERLEKELNR
jgi:uncharacterized membrane protein (DUF485 family)